MTPTQVAGFFRRARRKVVPHHAQAQSQDEAPADTTNPAEPTPPPETESPPAQAETSELEQRLV
jgi:hypothetical protein